jgi:hypothetical protein
MRVKQRIKFTGKNLHEIFNLPCVKSMLKDDDDKPVLIMKPEKLYHCNNTCVVFVGDFIEELDNGTWQVIRMQFNKIRL